MYLPPGELFWVFVAVFFLVDGTTLGSLLSFAWYEFAKLHNGDVQRQAFMSSSWSFAMFLSLHFFSGNIGLSIGPNTMLEGTKQSRTIPIKQIY